MKKKITSILLATLFTLSLLAGPGVMTARAATIAVEHEAELRTAIVNAASGDIIAIEQDITLTADLTVDKNVTLASSGHAVAAGSYKIVIPSGNSVSFGGNLAITGSAMSGFESGRVIVRGTLTVQPGNVSITNNYTGTSNSNAIYVDGGTLDLQGGTISDTTSGTSNVSSGVYLNGGSLVFTYVSSGAPAAVSGSTNGVSARNGASVTMYSGSVSGRYGIAFNGSSGGSFSMTRGIVHSTRDALSIIGSTTAVVSGGTLISDDAHGLYLEEGSVVGVTACSITGNADEGGIYIEGGSTLNLTRDSTLSIIGGIKAANGYIGGTTFLSSLPDPVSIPVGGSGGFTLTGASTVYTLNTAKTAASLGAMLSGTTVDLSPTQVGMSLPLVLTSSVTWNDSDENLTETINLTIPVTVSSASASTPTVTTGTVTGITPYGASLSGNVTSDGGAMVTERGFVWGTTADPTVENGGKVTSDSGTGVFSEPLTGLTPGNVYHVRAYAVNSAGMNYGEDVCFTTSAAVLPQVATAGTAYTSDVPARLSLYGAVTSEGSSAVTQRGFVYTTVSASSGTDTLILSGANVIQLTASSGGAGNYSATIDSLSSNMVYYYRAYATSAAGTVYGAIKTATTHGITFHVSIEDGGTVEVPVGTASNENGALYWNGTNWSTDSTAAHVFFTSLLTEERIIPLQDVAVTASTTYAGESGLYSSFIAVSAGSYSYTAVTASGLKYTYTGVRYDITVQYSDLGTGDIRTDRIVLLSRGVGDGTGSAYFDVYIQVGGSNFVTGVLSDPNLVKFSGMTMTEALAAESGTGAVFGSFTSAGAEYFMDLNGGADMGGLSYIFRTGAFKTVNTDDTSSLYSTGFTLRYHGGSDIVNLNFTPSLTTETVKQPAGQIDGNPATGDAGGPFFVAAALAAGITGCSLLVRRAVKRRK